MLTSRLTDIEPVASSMHNVAMTDTSTEQVAPTRPQRNPRIVIPAAIAAILAAAALTLAGIAAAVPCESDDAASNFACHWSADEQGDGKGDSFFAFAYGRWAVYL